MSQPFIKQELVKQEPIKQELKPDHGENFLPGSEVAPDHMAPQPLDHFKRGYKERADLRDRELEELTTDFDTNAEPNSQPSAAQAPVQQQQQQHRQQHRQQHPPPMKMEAQPRQSRQPYQREPPMGDVNHRPMQRKHEYRSSYVGPSGFDATRVVDALCRPGCNLGETMDQAKEAYFVSFKSGKAVTAILSNLARRRKMGLALSVWQWMDHRDIEKNVYHYNSLISVCEKVKDNQRALRLLEEMERRGIRKNEVTFSSAISACEKAGQWREALGLLDRMEREGVSRTPIAYNAAISACEKGLVPHKALELFEQMKREGVTPTVITFSALISAAEKGQQWKLALEVLEEMKASGHGANVIAYSAAISALSKGQMWEKALELFREIESSGNTPSIVTYNATMTALEKGLQWERALDLFDEMKAKRLPITVVSYGSAISACEKGLQYRQCLEYLDEMTELGIKKNVIIFGAAMSCMEKCCRADIAFQLMERMKMEGVAPNVHIYNSAISACARCGLWEKGLGLFEEMETVGVVRDVVSFNAVLDAVCSQVKLGRRLFELGIEKGFYARVSRLGSQWLELDLHFLSLGGGEIALGWWFEECLVPYLVNTSKLEAVKSIDIVTGYGKTRMRGIRHGDDGMRKRVRAMLQFMSIEEVDQPNKGRIHIDKKALIEEVKKNGGKIVFDEVGYHKFKALSTTANHYPDVQQHVRPRYHPLEPFPPQDDSNDRRPTFQPPGSDRRGTYDSRPGSSAIPHNHNGNSDQNGFQEKSSGFQEKYRGGGDYHRRGNDNNTHKYGNSKVYDEHDDRNRNDSNRHGSFDKRHSSDYDRDSHQQVKREDTGSQGYYRGRHGTQHQDSQHFSRDGYNEQNHYASRHFGEGNAPRSHYGNSEKYENERNQSRPKIHHDRQGGSFEGQRPRSRSHDSSHPDRSTSYQSTNRSGRHFGGKFNQSEQARGSTYDRHNSRREADDHDFETRRGSHNSEMPGRVSRPPPPSADSYEIDQRDGSFSDNRSHHNESKSSQFHRQNHREQKDSFHARVPYANKRSFRESGETYGQGSSRRNDSDRRYSHYQSETGDRQHAGEKRASDSSEQPPPKRRGYDIDQTSRPFYSGSRGV